MEKNIFSNYESLIQPFFEKLKTGLSDKTQQQLIMVLEKNMEDMFSPFVQKLSDPLIQLTPSEIQVALMIRQGLSNKEIAGILYKSVKTIDAQRASIRKKLHLRHKKINLRSFLLNL
jgi:DNA-binding CsgD family transcriptional regulator